ncbi:MAG: redoxin family protein [Planctomycetota bacterium]
MRTNPVFVAILASLSCALAQDPPKPPAPPAPPAEKAAEKTLAIGDELPKGLSYRGLDGKLVQLDSLRGKVVVLHFWSMTCPTEVHAEPKLNALSAEFADKGVVMLGVAANANEIGAAPDAKEFETKDADKLPYGKLRAKATESKCNHAIVVDHGGQLGQMLEAKTTPHCFVFDQKGKLQYQGALDDDSNGKKESPTRYLRDAVTAVLAGETPGVQITKPYG